MCTQSPPTYTRPFTNRYVEVDATVADAPGASEHFFTLFNDGVTAVVRTDTGGGGRMPFAPRTWLGVDEASMAYATQLEGFEPHGAFTFSDHPSELVEHVYGGR